MPSPSGPLPSRSILGMRVHALDRGQAVDEVMRLVAEGRPARVAVANVHMVMEAHDDPAFREVVNRSSLAVSDGMPLVWMLHLLGEKGAERIYGPRLMDSLLAAAAERSIPVGIYGGTEAVLARLERRIGQEYSRLRLAYVYSPPFRELSPEEDERIVGAINGSGAKLLFVGLGCPKQEKWMAGHEEAVRPVMVGVGAAFDFLAGAKAQAPAWVGRLGMEWLFRLFCEPRRLWRRYLYHNPRFLWLAARQLMRRE